MIIESSEHPIERIMDTAFNKLRTVVSADTIIGSPVFTQDGVSIFPISRVTLGFIKGGGEYGETKTANYPFAGGSGTGVSVTPIGFLVCDAKGVKVTTLDDKPLYEKLIDLAPEILKSILKKDDKKK